MRLGNYQSNVCILLQKPKKERVGKVKKEGREGGREEGKKEGREEGRKKGRKEGRKGGRKKREKGKSSLNKLGVSFFSTCKKSRSRKLRAGPQLHDAIGIQAPISFHSAILLCSSLWVPRWALHLPTVCPCSCWKKVKIEGKGAKMLKPAKSVLLLRVFLEVLLNNFCYHHRIENMIALFCKEDWEI